MPALWRRITGALPGVLLYMVTIGSWAQEKEYQFLGPVEIIKNGVVELAVAAHVGRVVSFRRTPGSEWLAVNDARPNPEWHWNPWGGDRVWPTPQALCPQIYGNTGFDPVIDGQPWEILEKGANFLMMRSRESQALGVRVWRRIELPEGEPVAVHDFRLEATGPRRFPTHVWTVSQVLDPDALFVETDRHIPHFGLKPFPFKWWPEYSAGPPQTQTRHQGRALEIRADQNLKLGTYGRWIAAVRGQEAFLQTISYNPTELYLEASNLQVYADTARSIYEIETLSPTWSPNSDTMFFWKVRWDLFSLDPGKDTTQQLLERTRAHHAPKQD